MAFKGPIAEALGCNGGFLLGDSDGERYLYQAFVYMHWMCTTMKTKTEFVPAWMITVESPLLDIEAAKCFLNLIRND